MILLTNALKAQPYDIMKGADPTTHTHICGSDDRDTINKETACVAGGRVGRVRKGLLPEFDVGFLGVEFDVSEEVFLRPRNP